MDPYVYPQSSILINKLDIKDEKKLIEIEAQLLIAGILDIDSIIDNLNFNDHSCLKVIHKFLFEDLYSWAGEFRTIDIYKDERVLYGLSVIYSHFTCIEKDLKAIFKWATTIDWIQDNPQLPVLFSKFMTDIWRVHPYREGNTRAVSIFMKLFADKQGLQFNEELLSNRPGYLRDALVMAAVNEAPEPKHIQKFIEDALSQKTNESSSIEEEKEENEKYRYIGEHDVSNYEEKPFYTKTEEEK